MRRSIQLRLSLMLGGAIVLAALAAGIVSLAFAFKEARAF